MKVQDMDDSQFGLLFAVRRSIRYHDRRMGFFENLHRLTNVLTVLMVGSVLHQSGTNGDAAWWLIAISVLAALLAATDMVLGYSGCAALHRELKGRFLELEIAILSGDDAPETWLEHEVGRLKIERDEPPIYRALDVLCHNEVAAAEGLNRHKFPDRFGRLGLWEQVTCHFYTWPDVGARLKGPT